LRMWQEPPVAGDANPTNPDAWGSPGRTTYAQS